MTKLEALKEAKRVATNVRCEMVVVHAPLEMAEDEHPYAYCPASAVSVLYGMALKGIGQKDCPALGIVARVASNGIVS